MPFNHTLAASLVTLLTLAEPQPVIVNLRWMHHRPGMTAEQAQEAYRSNVELSNRYTSLSAMLGPGTLYIEGFKGDEELRGDIARHALRHQAMPTRASELDAAMRVDGPLFAHILEGRLTAQSADMPVPLAAYDSAAAKLRAHELREVVEAREDATIERIARDRPRVAYVLLGCTHHIADAVARKAPEYRLITVTTPQAAREPLCDDSIFGPPIQ